ncbi:TetR/AcrR family transcriptional regulator [Puniceibacterium sp. IMCC21224]|jgi:AcrR family transcriptional regulator|uniref:TetR/AcrR family transcriptional regulator n=1 Tax=Puniceibacterium sp. IMCC21224 TaxID=1618204 RepID=UPI00064D939D|nr:TetR/AcrR family transcriptional regulator [Puniceibacterium sp. IMCC21224]KMK64640.1 transcriptional regulator, TetR family [Puniceibacterium sp. IMCC21224]
MQRVLTSRADALPKLAEAFREHGFEGASLSMLSNATGLGKGSLYNFFPGGKEEMMAAVLADIDQWFAEAIFSPLEQNGDPSAAITSMMGDVTTYFRSGNRVCLIGWVGLGASCEAFTHQVKGYFARWISSLAHCLEQGQVPALLAVQLAEETVSGIQGAIILSRALGEEAAFSRIIGRCEANLLDAVVRYSK